MTAYELISKQKYDDDQTKKALIYFIRAIMLAKQRLKRREKEARAREALKKGSKSS